MKDRHSFKTLWSLATYKVLSNVETFVIRVRRGVKGHPGTVWVYAFCGMGFIAGLQKDLWTAFAGLGVMVTFFGPLYLWGAYSRGKEKEHV